MVPSSWWSLVPSLFFSPGAFSSSRLRSFSDTNGRPYHCLQGPPSHFDVFFCFFASIRGPGVDLRFPPHLWESCPVCLLHFFLGAHGRRALTGKLTHMLLFRSLVTVYLCQFRSLFLASPLLKQSLLNVILLPQKSGYTLACDFRPPLFQFSECAPFVGCRLPVPFPACFQTLIFPLPACLKRQIQLCFSEFGLLMPTFSTGFFSKPFSLFCPSHGPPQTCYGPFCWNPAA